MTTFHSTRSTTESLTSKQAIRKGIADDGGLFVTDSLGETHVDVASLAGKSYQQIAFDVLSVLLPDFSEAELKACIDEAYGAQWSDEKITPVKPLGDDYVMELFNGPTSAFKDVALQILPRFMARTTPAGGDGNEKIMIVTATSGDTGKAALAGFADAEGTGITVFYPEGKVSQVQELQMSTQAGSNVNVCAVKGNFDDAQSAVKRIFGDRELANRLASDSHVVLSSANSINVGRLVPQVVYYFSAYAQLLEQQVINVGDEVEFVVPTGNFGDILAGYYAKLLGLPVTALEDRPEFAEELRQAGADAVLCLPFAEGLAQIPGGQETYFVVVTRAHSCDIACLRSILQKPAAYVGMMGSRKRAALVHTQLAELGLPQERIDALHAPIGLSIGAKTAQEIALSILAEIVSVKNSRQQTEGFSPALLAALEQQTAPAVLATIVGRHGSTPREEGSKMLVLPDGSAVGSVGGGIMEYRTQQLARELLEPGAAPCRLAAFTTEGASDAAAIAACGGSMEVFLQRLEPEE